MLILWKDIGKLDGNKPFPVHASEIKNLIDGGEEMDVNKKGIAAIDEDVTGARFIDANCLPSDLWPLPEDQKAIANRFMIIPFKVPIDDGDVHLATEIIEKEGGALLALMVRMYKLMIEKADGQPFGK